MNRTTEADKKPGTADWLFRGLLTKVGDTVDHFTGRRWTPSSSLATSELIERIKAMLDTEACEAAGGSMIVPHNIRLKIQWNKFSIDNDAMLQSFKNELLAATVDHINNKLYYTKAPVSLEVLEDYFTEGVRVLMNFGDDAGEDAESNLSLPSQIAESDQRNAITAARDKCVARFLLNGGSVETEMGIPAERRITVGRTAENMLRIDDASVSKYHASIGVTEDGEFTVSDIGSTNGTFLNDERLSYGAVTPLPPGGKVTFGTVEVTLEYIPAPETEEAAENVEPENTIMQYASNVSSTASENLPTLPAQPVITETELVIPEAIDTKRDEI